MFLILEIYDGLQYFWLAFLVLKNWCLYFFSQLCLSRTCEFQATPAGSQFYKTFFALFVTLQMFSFRTWNLHPSSGSSSKRMSRSSSKLGSFRSIWSNRRRRFKRQNDDCGTTNIWHGPRRDWDSWEGPVGHVQTVLVRRLVSHLWNAFLQQNLYLDPHIKSPFSLSS